MKITGEATLVAPVEQVWDALLDPAVLVRTIPGCERLEETADNTYDMTVTAGVASIRGTYAGTCRLSDLTPHESLKMNLAGCRRPGHRRRRRGTSASRATPTAPRRSSTTPTRSSAAWSAASASAC